MHTPINIGYEENIQINRKIYTKNKISSKKTFLSLLLKPQINQLFDFIFKTDPLSVQHPLNTKLEAPDYSKT